MYTIPCKRLYKPFSPRGEKVAGCFQLIFTCSLTLMGMLVMVKRSLNLMPNVSSSSSLYLASNASFESRQAPRKKCKHHSLTITESLGHIYRHLHNDSFRNNNYSVLDCARRLPRAGGPAARPVPAREGETLR